MMDYAFVAVGTSFGGFHALKTVLSGLPEDFPLPVGIVQHRSCQDSEGMAPLLATHIKLPLIEVEDKERIQPGNLYVCPANYHLLVDGDHFALSTGEPVLHARPSVDVFFESVAEAFGERVIGVLLTGMSKDGTVGLKKIKEAGGYVMVQDPAAAEGHVMPEVAIASVEVDKVLPLEKIASFLCELSADQGIKV